MRTGVLQLTFLIYKKKPPSLILWYNSFTIAFQLEEEETSGQDWGMA